MDELLKQFIGWNMNLSNAEKILDIKHLNNVIYISTDSNSYKFYVNYGYVTFEDLDLFTNYHNNSIDFNWYWSYVGTSLWVYTGSLTNRNLRIKECERHVEYS